MSNDRALNAFLHRYLEDRVAGTPRSLDDYLALFPGHEAPIAEHYRAFETADEAAPADRTSSLDRVGPYRILREIGRGGQGVVYFAEDERLHRKVALKVLTGLGLLAPHRLARFLREAQVASRLDHPGIATVYETGTEAGVPYIAMRYMEGETLAGQIATSKETPDESDGMHMEMEQAGRLDRGLQPAPSSGHPSSCAIEPAVGAVSTAPLRQATEIARIIEKAARALHVAHENGVIHRDVKPGNILVTSQGEPVILDFGLAHDADGELATITQTGDFFGTPAYMSPEQIATQKIRPDRRTDIWSLGATLYECLTLRRPFGAPTREGLYQAILTKEPLDVGRLRRDIPKDLQVIVQTALQKDRDRRYQTMAALADDLRALLEGRPIAARPIGPVGRFIRWSQRETAKAALLLVLLLALPTIAAFTTHYLANRDRVEAARLLALQSEKDELISLGSAELAEFNAGQAINYFERALQLEGGSPEAAAAIAMTRLDTEEPREALNVLDARASVLRGRRVAILLRAEALRQLDRKAEADALEKSAPQPVDALDFYLEGDRLMKKTLAERHSFGTRTRDSGYARALQLHTQAILLSAAPRALYFHARALAAKYSFNLVAAKETARALCGQWPHSWVSYVASGYMLSSCNRDEEAIPAFREAIRLKADSATSYAGLAIALHKVGALDDALAAIRQAITLNPRRSVYHGLLATSLAQKGLFDDAMTAEREALRLSSSNIHARVDMAKILADQGHLDQAMADCAIAVDMNPRIASLHQALGSLLLRGGRVDEAIAAFQRAMTLEPESPEPRAELAEALERKGRLDDAIDAWRTTIKLAIGVDPDGYRSQARPNEPFEVVIRVRMADALRQKGLVDDAIAECRRAIEQGPTIAYARSGLAQALLEKGQLQEAVAASEEAVSMEPGSAALRHNFGLILAKQGQAEAAEAQYRKALELDPRCARAHVSLGILLAQKGLLEEALKHHREAVRFERSPYVYENLGATLIAAGLCDEALEVLRAAVRIESDCAGARFNMGVVYFNQARHAEALEEFERCARLTPDNARAHYLHGLSLFHLGRAEEAILPFQRSVLLDAKSPQAHCDLGRALRDCGRFQEALESLRRGDELAGGKDWGYPSREWIEECEELVRREARLLEVVAGRESPKGSADLLELARLAAMTRRQALSVRWYREAFEADPALAVDLEGGHRCDAIRAAVAAATANAESRPQEGEQRRMWLRQALAWLDEDLASWRNSVEDGSLTSESLRAWALRMLNDRGLAAIREAGAVSRLPAAEQKRAEAFWAAVRELRDRSAPR